MSIRLFNLKNVPEDEANEIRKLLKENGIEYYETHAGPWGVSAPALWLNNSAQLTDAEGIIDDYQHQRTALAREAYAKLKREGLSPTWRGNIMKHPLRFILLLLFALFILYVTLSPFLRIGR